ncbi:MAG: SUMF1/EgtB/PvdO family nonheme iron enzyme [Myxococcales bacterium]|nr:SUMF1/EgtB/PvdO family nonheme iron enzyme [Myxococcales bacterium]
MTRARALVARSRGGRWARLGAAVVSAALLAACFDALPPLDDAAVVDAREVDAAEVDAGDPDAREVDAPRPPDSMPPDVPVDAPLCTAGATRCAGNDVETCQGGAWAMTSSCPNVCDLGACATPPSCSGGVATCGPGGNETCCASPPVPGGAYARSYDGVTPGFTDPSYAASVSDHHLDVFEVTMARFQKFVDAYPAARPADGSGRNPHNPSDVGWAPAWSASLPATQAALIAELTCDGLTTQPVTDPVRCVSWYVAQAFCIWDGGRLPSEAEWNYAAAGGNQQRVYPWSVPASSTTITSGHATYQVAAPTRPGLHTLDLARWGQRDLAGNVWEWVIDFHASPYPSTQCTDCANQSAAANRVIRGGGYSSNTTQVITSYRSSAVPATPRSVVGFRCARNPMP